MYRTGGATGFTDCIQTAGIGSVSVPTTHCLFPVVPEVLSSVYLRGRLPASFLGIDDALRDVTGHTAFGVIPTVRLHGTANDR